MKFIKWTKKEYREWDDWLESRPNCIKKMCFSHPADQIYRMKSTGHIATIFSYSENGTVKVVINNEYVIQTSMERFVFGVTLDDLELLEKEIL